MTISVRRSGPLAMSYRRPASLWRGKSDYTPDGSRFPGQAWEKTSTFGASAALSYRPTPALMFGAEADYDRAYGGLVRAAGLSRTSFISRADVFIINSTKRSTFQRPSSPKRPSAGSTSTNSRASSPS